MRSVAFDECWGPAPPRSDKSCCIQAPQEGCVSARCFSEGQVCCEAQAGIDGNEGGCDGDVRLPDPIESSGQALLVHLPPAAHANSNITAEAECLLLTVLYGKEVR